MDQWIKQSSVWCLLVFAPLLCPIHRLQHLHPVFLPIHLTSVMRLAGGYAATCLSSPLQRCIHCTCRWDQCCGTECGEGNHRTPQASLWPKTVQLLYLSLVQSQCLPLRTCKLYAQLPHVWSPAGCMSGCDSGGPLITRLAVRSPAPPIHMSKCRHVDCSGQLARVVARCHLCGSVWSKNCQALWIKRLYKYVHLLNNL